MQVRVRVGGFPELNCGIRIRIWPKVTGSNIRLLEAIWVRAPTQLGVGMGEGLLIGIGAVLGIQLGAGKGVGVGVGVGLHSGVGMGYAC